jgi:hypothetical protein
VTAAAARTGIPMVHDNEDDESPTLQCCQAQVIALDMASSYNVDSSCIAMLYMSPSPYHDAFDKVVDIQRCGVTYNSTHVPQHPRGQDSLMTYSVA